MRPVLDYDFGAFKIVHSFLLEKTPEFMKFCKYDFKTLSTALPDATFTITVNTDFQVKVPIEFTPTPPPARLFGSGSSKFSNVS